LKTEEQLGLCLKKNYNERDDQNADEETGHSNTKAICTQLVVWIFWLFRAPGFLPCNGGKKP
jgi:hypothetical protein